MRYRAVIFDIDGTLVPKELDAPTRRVTGAVRTLRESGCKVIIATGRSLAAAREVLGPVEADYFVTANGGRVTDEQGKCLYENPMTQEEMYALVKELRKTAQKNEVAASAQLIEYRELVKSVQLFGKDVETMKQMLTTACSDEERAKNQLVKLQMILNEVRLKTTCHRLPSISSQYNTDLQEGDRLIRRVRSVLEHTPLDVSELNADLQEAIDFIYKLYNNASNLVGIAIMVENAIVFGNRYRSSYPSIDSELTRAELSFQNGEYTKALKIAIQSIEKMHPGIYEKLIKSNDPGIMNQAA